MSLPATLGPSEVQRLKEIILDGVKTLEEIESLRLGIADTIKAVAEELDIPAKLLKKAISLSHKGNYAELEEELSDLEAILTKTGRK
jgi:hypothetical protein